MSLIWMMIKVLAVVEAVIVQSKETQRHLERLATAAALEMADILL
jgi:hypothetical protein